MSNIDNVDKRITDYDIKKIQEIDKVAIKHGFRPLSVIIINDDKSSNDANENK